MAWAKNELTDRLKLSCPIFQAPMGDITTPALAASVAESGGLGGLGMWGFSAADAERRIAGFRQLTGGSLNVNYPLWPHPGDLTGKSMEMRQRVQALFDEYGLGSVPDPEVPAGVVDESHLEVLQKLKPEVVSFHFGLPDAAKIAALKGAGCVLLASATNLDEANAIEAAGVPPGG